jgi:hypothetical protein
MLDSSEQLPYKRLGGCDAVAAVARIGWAALADRGRGLAEGDEALVANETGGLTLRVKLSEAVLRGVALSHKGR